MTHYQSAAFSILLSLSFFSVATPAFAIPPPDLIVSGTQALVASFGVLSTSLVLSLIYFRQWLGLLRKRTLVISGLVATCLIGSIFYYSLYYLPAVQLKQFKAETRAEISGIWEEYLPVYDAPSESTARRELLNGVAREITWTEFNEIISGQAPDSYLLLDIRDRVVFERGNIPGSSNIRLADLFLGEWESLISYQDKPIFIICYLGSTGAIASNFLAEKGFRELYQPAGGLIAQINTEPTFPFVGERFIDTIHRPHDRISLAQFSDALNNPNLTILDLRSPDRLTTLHGLAGTHRPFFREIMSTERIAIEVQNLSKNNSYLMVCNSDASCYQAALLQFDLAAESLPQIGIYELPKK